MNVNPCGWCGKIEPTDNPRYGFCSHECWYEAMGQYDGFEIEDTEEEQEII